MDEADPLFPPDLRSILCNDGTRLPHTDLLHLMALLWTHPESVSSRTDKGHHTSLEFAGREVTMDIDTSNLDVTIWMRGPDWRIMAITVGDGYKIKVGPPTLLDARIVIVNASCRNAENFQRDQALFRLAA